MSQVTGSDPKLQAVWGPVLFRLSFADGLRRGTGSVIFTFETRR